LKKSLLYGDFADVDFEAVDVHVLTSFIKVISHQRASKLK